MTTMTTSRITLNLNPPRTEPNWGLWAVSGLPLVEDSGFYISNLVFPCSMTSIEKKLLSRVCGAEVTARMYLE